MKYLHLFFPIIFLFTLSCKHDKKQHNIIPQETKFVNLQDTLKRINNALLVTDNERIEAYIKRMNFDMQSTETGLRFQIVQHGHGKQARKGMSATFHYKIELLDGTLCYISEEGKPRKVKIGQSGQEIGLDEALTLMHEGDKARFILPPYMAHGLLGDLKKIPARAVIYYEIELIKLDE